MSGSGVRNTPRDGMPRAHTYIHTSVAHQSLYLRKNNFLGPKLRVCVGLPLVHVPRGMLCDVMKLMHVMSVCACVCARCGGRPLRRGCTKSVVHTKTKLQIPHFVEEVLVRRPKGRQFVERQGLDLLGDLLMIPMAYRRRDGSLGDHYNTGEGTRLRWVLLDSLRDKRYNIS